MPMYSNVSNIVQPQSALESLIKLHYSKNLVHLKSKGNNMFKINDRVILKFYKDELEKEIRFVKKTSMDQPIQEHIQNANHSLKEYLFNSLDNMLADSYRKDESENKIKKLKEKLTDIEDNYLSKVVIIDEF